MWTLGSVLFFVLVSSSVSGTSGEEKPRNVGKKVRIPPLNSSNDDVCLNQEVRLALLSFRLNGKTEGEIRVIVIRNHPKH